MEQKERVSRKDVTTLTIELLSSVIINKFYCLWKFNLPRIWLKWLSHFVKLNSTVKNVYGHWIFNQFKRSLKREKKKDVVMTSDLFAMSWQDDLVNWMNFGPDRKQCHFKRAVILFTWNRISFDVFRGLLYVHVTLLL